MNLCSASFTTSMLLPKLCKPRCIMTDATGLSRHQPRKPRRVRLPPLTHFLCLPLVNAASISQLETSLEAFKSAHILNPGPTAQQIFQGHADDSRLELPTRAFRPLGTLHLTLGVMSLPSKERLDQAIDFFHSLDLVEMMRDVVQASSPAQQDSSSDPLSPFTISLESLHALPRPKSATVLHASPVDSTNRLLPFCVKLRDKFIDAGFIQNEPATKPTAKKNPTNDLTPSNAPSSSTNNSDDVVLSQPEARTHSESASLTENPSPSAIPPARKPTPRPLLLHATLVNTIYVRGRPNAQPAQGKEPTGKNKPKRITFDARNLISQYRHYYSDDKRTIPHSPPLGFHIDTHAHHGPASPSISDDGPRESIEQLTPEHESPTAAHFPPSPSYPFIWAKEIPLDTICICEMGAKKLDPGVSDGHGLNERLGEQYTVVAERGLLLSQPSRLPETTSA